jgi:hypothetical protein
MISPNETHSVGSVNFLPENPIHNHHGIRGTPYLYYNILTGGKSIKILGIKV